jgi:hypothetical protein
MIPHYIEILRQYIILRFEFIEISKAICQTAEVGISFTRMVDR